MKSILFLLLGLFFVNCSNSLVGCNCCTKNSQAECVLCESTPCQCEQLTSEESNYKFSIKKIILSFLKKVNYKSSDPQTDKECRKWCDRCSKNQRVAKLLRGILGICKCTEEEETIREIIKQLLDTSECEKNPCQIHCDPHVQEVLRAILKKAAPLKCQECLDKLSRDSRCRSRKEYKYWFRVSKEAMREELKSPPKNTEQNVEECPRCQGVLNQKYNTYRKVYNCACEKEKKNKINQRPKSLICPRYLTDDCRQNFFSICADCSNCRIHLTDQKNFAALFCEDCCPLTSPFVQFTPNGYPVRREPEILGGLKIKTKFLQINDLRSEEEKRESAVFNPFRPKCNFPRKRRGTRGIKNKRKRSLLLG